MLASDHHITILITDINMPGISGYELAVRAQSTRSGLPVRLQVRFCYRAARLEDTVSL
jgi:hypothetical protein